MGPPEPCLCLQTGWCVYILRCADRSLYIGHTGGLEWRMLRHIDGRGCRYTAARLPVVLVYSEPAKDRFMAIVRERQLKGWTRAKKDALIAGDLRALKRL